MRRATVQLGVVIALHLLFSWCRGGITNINCAGNIWVEPATVIKMGMNISIYCQANFKSCQPRRFYFYKNGVKERFHVTRINRTTAQLWHTNFRDAHASMLCTAECPGHFQETLICGKDISSGYPPDTPAEVMCFIYEDSGNMTCTWNPGRRTYVDTEYVVHVKSLETEEELHYFTSSYINISTEALQGGRKYLVWVQAVNALGMEESPQLHIHLDDIVIPSASIISKAETINATLAKTIVHWNSKTKIGKVFCEVRYKAETNQTWNVKGFDTNFTSIQQSEFYLEPNTKYVFQVRCQETGKRYWQPWSSPFVHKTPKTVPQVTPKLAQRDAWNHTTLNSAIVKEDLTSDNRPDIRLLSGMVFLAVALSVFSLVGIFKRSLRTGIKRKILLLIPNWLHEDIPNMENSNVAKLLQEKSEFVNINNASEQILYMDPVITEIKEVFLPEHKPTVYQEGLHTGPLATRACLQRSLSSTSVAYIPDLHTGYKPQVSHFPTGGNYLSNSDDIDSSGPKLPSPSFDLGKNTRSKKYPDFAFSFSSVNSLSSTLILEELSLILNQGECSPPNRRNSVEEESTMFLENELPCENIPEQTLLPDEFVSCLAMANEALPSINSYIPQNVV
uniref:interleukin-23 receptor n=1 Tax=Jaculus jaculus TaxID=51337 RepID=UPI001E1B3F74|nr:interleukin-23 receptor [Jaculus jaculus]